MVGGGVRLSAGKQKISVGHPLGTLYSARRNVIFSLTTHGPLY